MLPPSANRQGPNQMALSDSSEMVVECATYNLTGSTEITNNEFPIYEIEWVSSTRSIREHPSLSGYTAADWATLEAWEAETDTAARQSLQFYKRDKENQVIGTIQTLDSTNSPGASLQDVALLVLRGIASYTDFHPVARKTSLFQGSDKPTSGDAGLVIGGDPFSGVPSGYSWRKTAHRDTKQGQGFRWTRVEEWEGATDWLVDRDNIF